MAAKPSPNSDDEDLNAIVSEQLRGIINAFALESDLDFAYNLQLEEALAASLVSQAPSSSSSSSSSSIPRPEFKDFKLEEISRFGTAHSRHVEKCDQMFQDWLLSELDSPVPHNHGLVTRYEWLESEFLSHIHDHGLKREVPNFPRGDLSEGGNTVQKPFGEGCSKGVENEGDFKLYFKGLVSEEGIGVGVAICDPEDKLIFEEKKRLVGNETSKRVVELKALITGLDIALALKLKRVCFYCDYYPLYQFVTHKWPPKQPKIAALVSQVFHRLLRFDTCYPKLVARHDIKFAFKLARDSILPQIPGTEDPAPKKKLDETCVICLEDCDVNRMFAVDGCLHRYCFSCMKQHVEVKLLQGLVPKCPHDGCKFDLNVDSCTKFLTPKDMATMRQRIKEASIPASEKVYCPYPRCSTLMTKGEVLEYTKDVLGANQSGVRKCRKCHGLFCINCKVPWHNRISCNDYKKTNNLPSEDVKLKSLASTHLWRQCKKCNHMIELAEGCYHMTCRCGHEFCYKCGAEWKNKKATCSCPLWTEELIWYNDGNRDFNDDDEEEEYDSEDEYYYNFNLI